MDHNVSPAAKGCLIGGLFGLPMWGIIIFFMIKFNALSFTWKFYIVYTMCLFVAFIIWFIREYRKVS